MSYLSNWEGMSVRTVRIVSQLCLLLLIVIGLIVIVEQDGEVLSEVEARSQFYLSVLEPSIRRERRLLNNASWNFCVEPRDPTSVETYLAALLRYNKFIEEIKEEVRTYPWIRFRNHTVRRTFRLLHNQPGSPLTASKLEWLKRLEIQRELFSRKKVYREQELGQEDPQALLQNSSLLAKLTRTWIQHYNSTTARGLFGKNATLERLRILIEESGDGSPVDYYFGSELEVSGREGRGMINGIWTHIRPFYNLLHAYIRGRLSTFFTNKTLRSRTLIPAHLLSWYASGTFQPAQKSEGAAKEDLSLRSLYQKVDDFYASELGLIPETAKFWDKSMFRQGCPIQCWNKVVCDLGGRPDDCRLLAHPDKNGPSGVLGTAHAQLFLTKFHELAHAQPYLALRGLGSSLFPEGLSQAFSLAASNPHHLAALELPSRNGSRVWILLEEALDLLPRLGSSFSYQRWTWDMLEGKVDSENVISHYWNLREELEGLDGSLLKDVETIAEAENSLSFLSSVLKFQLHEKLCEVGGELDRPCDFRNLGGHRTTILGLMKGGSSVQWQDRIEELIGTRQVNASALLTYFQPLFGWLEGEERDRAGLDN